MTESNKEEKIWLDIPGYEGIYMVSSSGDIKSVSRSVERTSFGPVFFKEQIIKQFLCNSGYFRVGLRKDGVKKALFTHRIVAMVFLPNPKSKETVNHINGDKTDNRVKNLEWSTRSENQHHAISIGLCKRGEDHAMSKLNNEDILKIRSMKGESKASIARMFNVSPNTIASIINRKTWTQV